MAMNVKFLKGSAESYAAITTKDKNTFYYVDESKLYLGEVLLSNEVSLAEFNALKDRVQALETWQGDINTWKQTFLTTQAATDKDQTDRIVILEGRIDEIVSVGGEANLVNDVKVDGTSVVVDKVAQLKKLAGKDTVATADIDNDAVTVDKLADAINEDIAKGVAAKAVTDTIGNYVLKSEATGYNDIWTEAKHNEFVEANEEVLNSGITASKVRDYDSAKQRLDTFLGTVTPDGSQDIIDTLTEINNYVGEHGEEFAALSERVTKIENGTTVVAKANADKDGNEFSVTYAKTADISEDIAKGVAAKAVTDTIGNYVLKSEAPGYDDIWTKNEHNTFVETNEVLNSGITAEKVSQIKDKVEEGAQVNKIETIKVMNFSSTGDDSAKIVSYDVDNKEVTLNLTEASVGRAELSTKADSADRLEQKTLAEVLADALTNAKTEIQGGTTNTVKDCVDAINALNAGSMEAKADINAISTSVNDVVAQLTWGEF